MTIKCTYDDCPKRFNTGEAMIKHKIKDPDHSYCKKCDHDCTDDLDFLIHQIQSSKHIACPICGREFQSKSGRDSHVETSHPEKQSMECAGCQEHFAKAASLMRHIEMNECSVIKQEHFERQRAEKQILRDAFEAQLDPIGGSVLTPLTFASSGADSNTGRGMTLLDDENAPISRDWQGTGRQDVNAPLQPETNAGYKAPRPPVEGMDRLALNKFPALPAQSRLNSTSEKSRDPFTNDDLLDFAQPEERTAPARWIGNEAVGRLLFPTPQNQNPTTSGSQLGAIDNMSAITSATMGSSTQYRQNMWANASEMSSNKSTVRTNDPNARDARIQTAPRISSLSIIDPENYWNNIEKMYNCPGQKCNRKFRTAEEFTKHLMTGAHVGGKVVCPSCLRKFNSVHALISHCEAAGNRKCQIRKSSNYDQVMRELTAGLIGTDGFLADGTVRYKANKVEDW